MEECVGIKTVTLMKRVRFMHHAGRGRARQTRSERNTFKTNRMLSKVEI
jgi:hypothetical protein